MVTSQAEPPTLAYHIGKDLLQRNPQGSDRFRQESGSVSDPKEERSDPKGEQPIEDQESGSGDSVISPDLEGIKETSPKPQDSVDHRWRPDTLVLGPGGIRGFMELGSLLAFEREGLLMDITIIVGVSVGALIGLLLTAGLTVREIIDVALRVNFFDDVESALHDLRSGRPYDVLSRFPTVRDRKGLLSNSAVKEELHRQLGMKFGFTPNLRQLYLATGIKLVVTTMNLGRRQPVYLSHESDPDLSVVDAVLLSMNIPLVFYQLRYRGDLYIDGAFANPYPVDLFSDTDRRILGISILSSGTPSDVVGRDQNDTVISYLLSIIYSTLDTIRDRIIRQSRFPNGAHHLHLVDRQPLDLDVVGLSFDVDQKTQLVVEGHHQAREFLGRLRVMEGLDQPNLDQGEDKPKSGHHDPTRPSSIVVESEDPIPLLSAFLASNPELTGALLAMSTGQGLANHNM